MLRQIDDAVLHFFGSIQCGPLNGMMVFISTLGNAGAVWIAVAVILLLFKRTRKGGATVAVALIIGLVVCNLILKPLVARVRPFDANDLTLLIAPPTDWSFPSGHTNASFAAAVAAGLSLKGKYWLLLIPASLIALSRLYLQVHYLTDVLAGAMLGSLAAVAAWVIIKALLKHKKTT